MNLHNEIVGASRQLDLMSIGESMVVLVSEDGKALERAELVRLSVAGAESNVAYYLAQLGYAVGWSSRLGDDPFGRKILTALSDVGIDVSTVDVAQDERTGVYFKDSHGGPSVHYYRDGSAASRMTVAAALPAVMRSARLHVSGITSALNGTSSAMLSELIDEARRAGVHVSFDVNFRPSLWTAAEAGIRLAQLAERADTVFVGRDEAESLWGTRTADDVRRFLPAVPALIVKDGNIGATAFLLGHEPEFVAAPRVDVVDAVGAGDAFAAGYLAALISGMDLTKRLRLGHIIAAHALQTRGDVALLPSRQSLLDEMNVSEEQWATLQFGMPVNAE